MLKKMKKIIIPVLLSAFFFGTFNTVLEYNNNSTVVYAAGSSGSSGGSGGSSGGSGGSSGASGASGSSDSTLNLGGIGDMPTFSISGGTLNLGTLGNAEKTDFFNRVFKEYQQVVIFIAGIGTISMILFFVLNFINLGKSQGNPQERQKAISGLIISGIATAGLGSVTLIVALFLNVI